MPNCEPSGLPATEGQATLVMVGEPVAPRQGNAVTAPVKPAVDLGSTFHVPVIGRLRTWTRILTSVITQFILRDAAVHATVAGAVSTVPTCGDRPAD